MALDSLSGLGLYWAVRMEWNGTLSYSYGKEYVCMYVCTHVCMYVYLLAHNKCTYTNGQKDIKHLSTRKIVT